MTSAEKRAIAPILRFVAKSNPEGLGAVAQTILDRVQRQPRVALSARPAAKARKARRLTKNEETARIREAVMIRSGGCCELCPIPGLPSRATELAHLEGGIGRRKQRQGVENTAASCARCNYLWDHKPEARPAMATFWACRTGIPIPPGILAAAALKGWTVPESRAANTVQPEPDREPTNAG